MTEFPGHVVRVTLLSELSFAILLQRLFNKYNFHFSTNVIFTRESSYCFQRVFFYNLESGS